MIKQTYSPKLTHFNFIELHRLLSVFFSPGTNWLQLHCRLHHVCINHLSWTTFHFDWQYIFITQLTSWRAPVVIHYMFFQYHNFHMGRQTPGGGEGHLTNMGEGAPFAPSIYATNEKKENESRWLHCKLFNITKMFKCVQKSHNGIWILSLNPQSESSTVHVAPPITYLYTSKS